MINYDADNYSLIGPDGKKVSPLQSDLYTALLAIRQRQIDAINTNTAAKQDYLQKLSSLQANIDAGRAEGLVPPAKPKEVFVTDDGADGEMDFSPPLPDPKYPTISGGNSTGFKPTSAPPDRIDVILQLLVQILQKLGK